MSEPRAERTLKSLPALSRIPAFPPVVLRVFDLLGQENVEIRKLVELITSDPAFSAQVLRLANSPLFGFQSRIDSLQHALMILGLRRVRSLAMTVATANYMQAALKIEELHRCWRHTLATALLTEELARQVAQPEDVAYTAGLLHDIGRLGLLVAHPVEYTQLMREAREGSWDLIQLERKFFGVDHCEAGGYLAEEWNLPEEVRAVAATHHEPRQEPSAELPHLVHLGCRLADTLGFWVTPPARAATLEEIRALLPESARQGPATDPDLAPRLIERRIRSHNILLPSPGESEPLGEEMPAEAEAQPAQRDVRETVAAVVPMRSLARDLTVVVLTGLIFSAVFIIMFYLVNR